MSIFRRLRTQINTSLFDRTRRNRRLTRSRQCRSVQNVVSDAVVGRSSAWNSHLWGSGVGNKERRSN